MAKSPFQLNRYRVTLFNDLLVWFISVIDYSLCDLDTTYIYKNGIDLHGDLI